MEMLVLEGSRDGIKVQEVDFEVANDRETKAFI